MIRTLFLIVALIGCAAPADLEPVLEPDSDRAFAPGTQGPHGVARTSWYAPMRIVERSRIEVSLPLDEAGVPLEGPLPAVVFLPGGLVAPERYRWIAVHAASRGYVVIAPDAPADLALFAVGNAREALDQVRRQSERDGPLHGAIDDSPAAIMGHSLGGVTAAQAWHADPDDFAALAMLAAFPTQSVDPDERVDSPVLSIIGSTDERADAQRVRDGFERFVEPRLFASVGGLNHYDWADDVTQGELARDGERLRPVQTVRADAMRVVDTWLDYALSGDQRAEAAYNRGGFPNVEVAR